MRALGPVAAVLIALLLVASSAMFSVDQRQNAIVFQLGEVKEVIVKPGLHFKWPLIQNVRLFDMRILTFDDAEPLRFITSEKKPVLVDSFVKWRIVDVKQYYVSVQGDELRAANRPSPAACRTSSAAARCTKWSRASATRSWTKCA
jgi:membrane protease subunit HflC